MKRILLAFLLISSFAHGQNAFKGVNTSLLKIDYESNIGSTFGARSLIDKGYADSIQALGANRALSNLASVAINTSLISDANNTDDLGSSALAWKDAYMYTFKLKGSTSGTITMQAPATAGTNTITLPANTGTVALTSDLPTLTKNMTLESPTSSENFELLETPVAITITEVKVVLVGPGSPSVTYNLAFDADRSVAGTNVFTAGQTVTSTTTGTAASSGFNDATIPAGSYIRLTTSALTDATRLQIRITYTED